MPIQRNEEAIKNAQEVIYTSLKEDITAFIKAAEEHRKWGISAVTRNAIDNVKEYLKTLEGELKRYCKDYLPIRKDILERRLISVRHIIAAIDQACVEKSDAPIVRCYHLHITEKIKYGVVPYSNLKDFLKSTYEQIKEGLLEPRIPPKSTCEITLSKVVDPVMLPTGQICEQSIITKWLNDNNFRCPFTRKTLHPKDLIQVSIDSGGPSYGPLQFFKRRGADNSSNEIDYNPNRPVFEAHRL